MSRVSAMISAVTAAGVLGGLVVATPAGAMADPGPSAASDGVPLREVVAALPVATEIRDGYDRAKFKHWVDADGDGCNTRAEVLLVEASIPPAIGPKCAVTGGVWYSTYDDNLPDRGQGQRH